MTTFDKRASVLHLWCTVPQCSSPHEVAHGEYRPLKEKYVVGDVVEFFCEEGYQLQKTGKAECRCRSDGKWSSEFPVCKTSILGNTTQHYTKNFIQALR